MNASISGQSSSVSTSETIALAGLSAVETTNAFESLSQVSLASSPAGQVEVRGQGQQATGSIDFTAQPTDGGTTPIGGVTYTYKKPEVSTMTMVADVAGNTSGLYADAQDKNGTVRIWGDVDGIGVAPAVPGGGRLLGVVYASGATASQRASAYAVVLNADSQFESSDSGNVVTIYDAALGNRTNISAGTGLDAVATVTNGAANNVANRVRIGIDRFQSARALAAAVLLTGTSGDDWGIGTVVNPIYDAYSNGSYSAQSWNGTSDDTLYMRDKIAVNRGGLFPISSTDPGVNAVSPTGGSDGALIALFSASSFSVTVAMSFRTPDVLTPTLIALTTPTSDAVPVLGRKSTIHLRAANITSPVQARIETSDDGITWADRSSDFSITNMDNNEQFLEVTNNVEWMRLVVTSNGNTVDVPINATVIF